VHAEDGALRRIDDRRGQQRTERAAIGDGERAALQIVQRQLAVARLLGVIGDALSISAKPMSCTSRSTGVTRPFSVDTAIEMSW
jgi:hypothetical protein